MNEKTEQTAEASAAPVRVQRVVRAQDADVHFPRPLMRAEIYGGPHGAMGVLYEQDFDGEWHETAWVEDDAPPLEVLRRLLSDSDGTDAAP